MRRKAFELFTRGVGYTTVSYVLDLPVNTVRDWQRQFSRGRFLPETTGRTVRHPEEVKKKVVAMRLGGASWEQIRRETGVSSTTARRWTEAAERAAEEELQASGAPIVHHVF